MKRYRSPEERANDAYSFIVMHMFNASDSTPNPPTGWRWRLLWFRVTWAGLRNSPRFSSDDFLPYWNLMNEKTRDWPGIVG